MYTTIQIKIGTPILYDIVSILSLLIRLEVPGSGFFQIKFSQLRKKYNPRDYMAFDKLCYKL